METKEIVERMVCDDPRIFKAMSEIRRNDKSFTEKWFIGFEPTYKQREVREIFFDAIAHGMKIGLKIASVEQQLADTSETCTNPRYREFYDKFLELAHQYNCAIVFHPQQGMGVMDLDRK